MSNSISYSIGVKRPADAFPFTPNKRQCIRYTADFQETASKCNSIAKYIIKIRADRLIEALQEQPESFFEDRVYNEVGKIEEAKIAFSDSDLFFFASLCKSEDPDIISYAKDINGEINNLLERLSIDLIKHLTNVIYSKLEEYERLTLKKNDVSEDMEI